MKDETSILQLRILLEDAKNALIYSGYAETHPLMQDITKELEKQTKRYRFTFDYDDHNYLIPADKRKEWAEFLEATYKADVDVNAEYPDQPEWVVEIDSHELWSFENPKLEK